MSVTMLVLRVCPQFGGRSGKRVVRKFSRKIIGLRAMKDSGRKIAKRRPGNFERDALRAAKRFQEARDLGELAEAIVDATGRATPGDLVYLQHFHETRGKVDMLAPNIPWPFNPEEQQRCASLWFRHPLVYSVMQEGWFTPRAVTSILPIRRWREERMYNEVFRRNRFDYQQAVNFPIGGGSSCGLIVMRSGLDFTPREQNAFELVRRMAVPALTRILRIERERAELSLLADGADHVGVAILGVDAEGRVRRQSRPAARLLREHNPHRPDALVADITRWVRACRRAGRAPQTRTFSTSLGALRVRPSIGRFAGDVFLFLEEVERRDPPPIYVEHGLSPRESEVLHGFVLGAPDAAIAESLGVGRRTVQEYSARIFGKLGVSNRHAAAAWARRVRTSQFLESPARHDTLPESDPLEALSAALAFQRHALRS